MQIKKARRGPKVGFWGLAPLGFLTIGLLGCVGLSEDIATHLANKELTKEGAVVLFEGDLVLFRQCLEGRGGECQKSSAHALAGASSAEKTLQPLTQELNSDLQNSLANLDEEHPAKLAQRALAHPFTKKMAQVHDHLRGLRTSTVDGVTMREDAGTSTLTLDTDLSEIQNFADLVHRSSAAGGWQDLSRRSDQRLALASEGSEHQRRARRDSRTLLYVRKYTEAYFDSGRFVQVELDTANLQNEADAYLSRELPWVCGADRSAKCDALVQKFVDEILKGVLQGTSGESFVFLSLGESGFTTRDGRQYRFPGFRVTFDPLSNRKVTVNKIDYTTVGSDLLAVFLQALYDSHEGLPALPGATGTRLGEGHEAVALPVFNPAVGNVSTDDFQKITEISNRVEAAVSTMLDRVVRGVGPFSLNNEALEQLVVTSIGVTTRKVSEKAGWCWFACNLDVDLKNALQEEEKKGKAWIDREAKQIKLRLRLGR